MTSPATERVELPVTAELMHEILTRTAEQPGADFRVLTYYVTSAALGDTIRQTAKDVAQVLKLSQGSVSRSIKRLLTDGWLQVAYTVGSVSFYRAGPKVMDLALAEAHTDGQHLAEVHHLPVRSASEDE